jgi:hypothetical protein
MDWKLYNPCTGYQAALLNTQNISERRSYCYGAVRIYNPDLVRLCRLPLFFHCHSLEAKLRFFMIGATKLNLHLYLQTRHRSRNQNSSSL